MIRLEDRLAALPTMSTAQLREEWERVHGEPAPQAFSLDLLARAIAWTLQERVHGGLSAVLARKLDGGSIAATKPSVTLRPGSRLARDWHGRTHHVLVLEEGYSYRDRCFRSLTAIAREITGAAWSGPRFFGLTGKQEKADAA